tara:strand:+ start:430 stop:3231 length:2802 start_codon:yes stop_codon:yes gene_type:complete
MTTFNNALANLQNNSNRMAALAKGYHTDVAKFQTKKGEDTARLFMLAGELGKDLASRLAERKAKEEEGEKTWQLFNDSYLGNVEIDSDFTKNVFNVSADQRTYSNLISNAERNKQISSFVATEANNSAGVGERALEQQKLGSIAIEFTPWYHTQVKNNTRTFDAVIPLADGTFSRQTFNINDPNLPREARFARLQYLTKQYVGARASGYDPKFLTYSPENGGSGFATSIMEQSDTIKKQIEKNIVSADGVNQRSNALTIFQDSNATASEIADAYTLIMNSGAKNGEGIMQRDKAWKFLHDNLKDSVENGYISYDRLEEIVDMKIFDINGKKTLAEYDPTRYGRFNEETGVQGSLFTEADNYKTKQDELITKRNKNSVNTEFEALSSEITSGTLDPRNKADLEIIKEKLKKITDIATANNIEGWDYAKKLKELQQLPNNETEPLGKSAADLYYKSDSGMRMSIASTQFSEDVQNTTDIQSIISLEKQIEEEHNKEILNVEKIFKKKELVLSGNSEIPQYTWPNTSTETMWELEKGRLLRLLVINDQLPADQKQLPRTLIRNFEQDLNEKIANAKLDTNWENYDKTIESGTSSYSADQQQVFNTSIYASDDQGVFRNAENHTELEGNFTYGWQSKMYGLKLEGADFTNPKTEIKEEQPYTSKYPVNENEDEKILDYNKLIEGENGLPSDLQKIANLQNLTALDYLQQRAQSVGQKLDEKSLEILCADIENNCSATVKNKLKKGEKLNHDDKANITKTCPTVGILNLVDGGEDGEKINNAILQHLCTEEVVDYTSNSSPLYKEGFEIYAKDNLGLGMGMLEFIGDTAKIDFEADGAEKLFETFSLEIPKAELLKAVITNDKAGSAAFEHSGDIKFLPTLDSDLLADYKQSNFLELLDSLTQFDFGADMIEHDNNEDQLDNSKIEQTEINSIKNSLD